MSAEHKQTVHTTNCEFDKIVTLIWRDFKIACSFWRKSHVNPLKELYSSGSTVLLVRWTDNAVTTSVCHGPLSVLLSEQLRSVAGCFLPKSDCVISWDLMAHAWLFLNSEGQESVTQAVNSEGSVVPVWIFSWAYLIVQIFDEYMALIVNVNTDLS